MNRERGLCAAGTGRFVFLIGIARNNLVMFRLTQTTCQCRIFIICVLRCHFVHFVICELHINSGHDTIPANVPTVVLLWPA